MSYTICNRAGKVLVISNDRERAWAMHASTRRSRLFRDGVLLSTRLTSADSVGSESAWRKANGHGETIGTPSRTNLEHRVTLRSKGTRVR